MLQQLRSLAEYSEQRWTSKIRAGVSFNVGTSTQQRPAEGARERRSRLHAADNWNMAHQLTEGGASCGDITSKGGGAGKQRCLFASDYVPTENGRSTTKLPFATLRPVPRQVPRQAAVLHRPDHNLPACERCKMRRRGVRNCCRLGYHKEDYWHKPQSKGICSMHSMKICDRCKINKRGVQYCCRSGHHDATRRKPGPKVGSKRLVEEQGQVSQKRRRMQGSVSDREAVRDSTPPTAPTLSNMRPRSNSAPQLGGASSASLYFNWRL